METIEIFLAEVIKCKCNAELYVRFTFMEESAGSEEAIAFSLFLPPTVRCWNCNYNKVDCNQEPNGKFHFGFDCEHCGNEQFRTTEGKPETVSCVCGKEYKVACLPYQLHWWNTVKPKS